MNFLQKPYYLILLFVTGIIAQLIPSLPENIHRKINQFILAVPLPAIVLTKIPHLAITHEVVFPVISAWLVFLVSAIYAYLFCKLFNYNRKTMACMILCCGLGNTSFVGYPFLKYFYGDESLKYAIFVDQPGSFLILSTFGVLVATYFSSANLNFKEIVFRLIQFPPFIAFVIALVLPENLITGTTYAVLDYTGKFMVPLAILSLGLQFNLSLKTIPWKKLMAGLIYKLVLAPFIIYILFYFILHKNGDMYTISILECAMPPMITSSLLATEYDLDSELANALPTLGIVFAIPTLLFWSFFLKQ
jgi:predicted permease